MSFSCCPACGYEATVEPCPHCGATSQNAADRQQRAQGWQGLWLGFQAPLEGALLLVRGPRLKRVLLAPFLLVAGLAAWLHTGWIAPGITGAFALAAELPPDPAWWERALAWTADSWMGRLLEDLSWFLALMITVWLSFTLLFEVVAGPFLDEIQARVERAWFGADPRERSVASRPPHHLRTTWLAACASLALAGLGSLLPGAWALLGALAGAGMGWGLAARLDPSWDAWLRQSLGHEWGLVWTSAKVALASLLVLGALIWLPLVPLVGAPLWLLISGFVLALGLFDVAFSRRGWPARERVRFVRAQWQAFAAFGLAGGFLVGIPLLGPILAVPSLSMGSLWLLVQLDCSRR